MHHDRIADYAVRIARAVALIEARSDGEEPPDLAELADAAALSPFHFHRVFRIMTGETVGAAIRRLRLARTLPDLTDGVASITDAAAGSGYASSQAFARAIRQSTGKNASELRADPGLAAQIAERLSRAPDVKAPLAIEVTSLAPFRVAALRRDGPYETLDTAFDTLFETVFSIVEMDALQGIWGVPLDDPFSVFPEKRRFDCALDVGDAEIESGAVTTVSLGSERVLAADFTGSYDDVHARFDELYREALSRNLELAATPPLICYHDQPDEKPEDELRSTLYLPIV